MEQWPWGASSESIVWAGLFTNTGWWRDADEFSAPTGPLLAGKQPAEGGEQCSIGGVEDRALDLPAQDGDFVPEDEQLDLFGGIGADHEDQQLENAAQHQVGEGPQLAAGSPPPPPPPPPPLGEGSWGDRAKRSSSSGPRSNIRTVGVMAATGLTASSGERVTGSTDGISAIISNTSGEDSRQRRPIRRTRRGCGLNWRRR